VVTGFLGSGKTTLVRAMLEANRGARLAVVVNEFGALGIDADLLRDTGATITELANGCICCIDRGNMARTLVELTQRVGDLAGIVVETSGVADPLGVADLLATHSFPTDLVLASVITVVDAEHFDRNLRDAEVAHRQLVAADVFVIGKSDLVSPGEVALIHDRLSTISTAPSVVSENGRCAVDVIAEIPATVARVPPGPVTGGGDQYSSVSWVSDRPLRGARFLDWLAVLPPAVCRVKALAWLDAGTYVVHRVHHRVTVLPVPEDGLARALGDDGAHVVLIGHELDELRIRNELQGLRHRPEQEFA
jgi:G3E family GTPase